MLKLNKILVIGIMILLFCVGQAYSAPKGNNGKANNGKANDAKANNKNAKANNGKSQTAKVNKGNNKSVSQSKGQSAIHRQQARRSVETNNRREQRVRKQQPKRNVRKPNTRGHRNFRESKERVEKGFALVNAINNARWSYNPKDDRGQGNMGEVDMQNPFGHDKDSDREKLDRSRKIQVTNNIEDVISIEWDMYSDKILYLEGRIDTLNDWIANNEVSDAELEHILATITSYEMQIQEFKSVETIRVSLGGEHFISYDLTLETDHESIYNIETTLVVTEAFTVEGWTDGVWTVTTYEIGDVFVLNSEEVTMNPEDNTYELSLDPDMDLFDGHGFNDGGFFNLEVNITDTETQSTVTKVMDNSLYIFRDPFGRVTDLSTGQAIVGAKIIVFTVDGSIVALDKASNPTASNPQITDATGRFAFNLRVDRKYYMTASAEGYEDYQSNVFTEQWHIIREDIKMKGKLWN